jgi:hypothetical protein
VPSCAGRTCGPDGCGGTCGHCPTGRECTSDGARCDCAFFDTLTYAFTATGVDWTQVRWITLNVNHIDLDGTPAPTSGLMMTESMPTGTVRVHGCAPHITVQRNYALTGGTGCSVTDTVMTESIAVPGATPSAGGCTAPPL